MTTLSMDFIKKIAHSLQDEEIDVYVLTLYCLNQDDMNYFSEKDRARVKEIFKVLIDDTKHHTELLKLIVDIGNR